MSMPGSDHHAVRTRVSKARVVASGPGRTNDRLDRVATEEPMEVRVEGPGQSAAPLVVTMRTPGDDFDLATGFLATEGLVASPDEFESVAYCVGPGGAQEYNVVTVRLRRPWNPDAVQRNFYASSSCGICGKATLDQVEVHCEPIGPGPTVTRDAVLGLPPQLRDAQAVFEQTGGLHAAGLFDAAGQLESLREDVGRHNALDKLLGEAFRSRRWPLSQSVVMVSGRVSFEIVQKCAVAGVPVVCAVSAPSSLAVDAARRFGMTVVGFLRDDTFNVYSHPERVGLDGRDG